MAHGVWESWIICLAVNVDPITIFLKQKQQKKNHAKTEDKSGCLRLSRKDHLRVFMAVVVIWLLFFPLKVVNSNKIQVCIICFILDQGGYSEKKIQPHCISDLFIHKHILDQLILMRFWHCFLAQGNTWGLVFRSVILFVCWNLPLNFLSHWMKGKYSGQVSPTLIIFLLKHSHIQFSFETMYWVSALPHTVLGDKEEKGMAPCSQDVQWLVWKTKAYLRFSVMNPWM